MRKIILLTLFILPSCTFAVNDPAKFEKVSVKETRTYLIERDALWSCFNNNVSPSGTDTTYQTAKEYVFQTKGIAQVKFRRHGNAQTNVMAQTAPNGALTPDSYLKVTDKCAGGKK